MVFEGSQGVPAVILQLDSENAIATRFRHERLSNVGVVRAYNDGKPRARSHTFDPRVRVAFTKVVHSIFGEVQRHPNQGDNQRQHDGRDDG